MTCHKCAGYGCVEVETGNPSPPGSAFDSYECYECDGSGQVHDGHKWVKSKVSGSPDEWVEYCDECGIERQDN